MNIQINILHGPITSLKKQKAQVGMDSTEEGKKTCLQLLFHSLAASVTTDIYRSQKMAGFILFDYYTV